MPAAATSIRQRCHRGLQLIAEHQRDWVAPRLVGGESGGPAIPHVRPSGQRRRRRPRTPTEPIVEEDPHPQGTTHASAPQSFPTPDPPPQTFGPFGGQFFTGSSSHNVIPPPQSSVHIGSQFHPGLGFDTASSSGFPCQPEFTRGGAFMQ